MSGFGAAIATPANATAASAAIILILFMMWFLSWFHASPFSRLHQVRTAWPRFLTKLFFAFLSPALFASPCWAHLHFSSAHILKQLKQLFFSPRNYAAFLNRRAVARRKGKLFQTSCFPSLEDVVVNYTDAPGECENRRIA